MSSQHESAGLEATGNLEDSCCEHQWGQRPVQGKKRVRRTYSGRRKTNHQTVDTRPGDRAAGPKNRPMARASGEVTVPSPIFRRARDKATYITDLESVSREGTGTTDKARRPQARYITKDGEAHYRLAEHLRQIRKVTNPVRYALYDGLYNALETLLKATFTKVLFKTPHSKTLFSMCLRSIPSRIKEEEEWVRIHAEEQRLKPGVETLDPSVQTYTDLESYGSSEAGWNHLRIVVRAHGVQYISDAISEGLLDVKFCSALVMLCVHTASLDEAEILLTSLLKSSDFPNPSSIQSQFRDKPALLPLSTLLEYSRYTRRTTYLHRQLDYLFTTRRLPVTWLATVQMNTVWTSLFCSLSVDYTDGDAFTFMIKILPVMFDALSSCDREVSTSNKWDKTQLNVLKTTFESVLTTISALAVLGNCSVSALWPAKSTRSINHSRMTQLVRTVIVDSGLFRSKLMGGHAGLFAISALVTTPRNADGNWFEDIHFYDQLVCVLRRASGRLGMTANDDTEYDLPAFLCSVARCCGRGASSSGFEYLQIILESFQMPLTYGSINGPCPFRQLIIDTAYAFAQHVPDRAHLDFAESLGINLHRHPLQAKATLSSFSGPPEEAFRWEEGINEWVTATPAVMHQKRTEVRDILSGHDSESDTPFKPVFKRRKMTGLTPEPKIKTGGLISSRTQHLSDLTRKQAQEQIVIQEALPSSESLPSVGLARFRIRLATKRPESQRFVRKSHAIDEHSNNSDDELSVSFNHDIGRPREILQELAKSNTRRSAKRRKSAQSMNRGQTLPVRSASFLEGSEDELGI
ncbi:MAG: hypothetical protein M1818_004712 [Claussenomyces sp. TS43310]|nr:MAG: hypothetical protein M1818_004712 [Claussenomyces sp. TS43310]